MQIFKSNIVKSAIVGTYTLFLFTFIVMGLYIGRDILIPITFAILLAFLLAPLVSILEKISGRVLAVILVIIIITTAIGITSYVLSKELIQFTTNLDLYKTNINSKINSLGIYDGNIVSNNNLTLNELKSKLYNNNINKKTTNVEAFDYSQTIFNFVTFILGSFINIVITTLLILLLVIFILIEREELRGKFIRLVGQERIGATTSAINDASIRVARYLRMFLFINIIYGLFVALGLYILGIPNALLWGALSAILRFVPYVGVWIAAAVPIALSFAISTSWFLPLLTISLFVILEAVSANILEPYLYGASTGVSAIALIIAAIFWTYLWGPMGLILSTPITVCLVVLGRHVPRLEFFSILLSDEEPLAIYEEFYHRFLIENMIEIPKLIENYLEEHSYTSLYDEILIPVIAIGEMDIRKEKLEDEQIHILHQNLENIIEDLSIRPSSEKEKNKSDEIKNPPKEMILCIPTKAKRDELVGEMLTQLLKQKKYNVFNISSILKPEEILGFIKDNNPKIIVISAVPPSTIIQVRHLVRIIHSKFPNLKIVAGLWGYSEKIDEIKEIFFTSEIDRVVTTISDTITYIDTLFLHDQ